jgi:predicted esterase
MVLYGRGRLDSLYTADLHAEDLAALGRLGVTVESVTFDGGHDWTPEFLAAVARTIARCSASS